MAYSKTNWVDTVTTVDASKLNNAELGIETNDKSVRTLNTIPKATGTATALVIATAGANFTLTNGNSFQFRVGTDGTIDTINVDGTGATSIRDKEGNQIIAVEDDLIIAVYDTTLGFFLGATRGGGENITGTDYLLGELQEAITKGDTVYIEKFTSVNNVAGFDLGSMAYPNFSSDGTYLAAGGTTSPYIYIYKRSGDTFTKLSDPATLPAGSVTGVNFSPSGTYLVACHTGSPYITIYKRSGDTFTKLSDPATLPTSARYAEFSKTETYLSVSAYASPYIYIYKRSGDTFTKLSNPATLPSGVSDACTFSKDDTYLSLTTGSSPYIYIYKRSGDTFTKLSNPAVLPTGFAFSCDFSPDSIYLAVGHTNAPCLTIYKRSGDTFTKLSNPSTLPVDYCYSVSFDDTGNFLCTISATSPTCIFYKRTGDTFTYDYLGGVSPSGALRIDLSPNADYFAFGQSTTSFNTLVIYKYKNLVYNANNSMETIKDKLWAGYARESGTTSQVISVGRLFE